MSEKDKKLKSDASKQLKVDTTMKKDDKKSDAPLSARARMLTDLANLDDSDPKLAILKAQ